MKLAICHATLACIQRQQLLMTCPGLITPAMWHIGFKMHVQPKTASSLGLKIRLRHTCKVILHVQIT